jgi:hypothetical protein
MEEEEAVWAICMYHRHARTAIKLDESMSYSHNLFSSLFFCFSIHFFLKNCTFITRANALRRNYKHEKNERMIKDQAASYVFTRDSSFALHRHDPGGPLATAACPPRIKCRNDCANSDNVSGSVRTLQVCMYSRSDNGSDFLAPVYKFWKTTTGSCTSKLKTLGPLTISLPKRMLIQVQVLIPAF